jgi:hypothetical protein
MGCCGQGRAALRLQGAATRESRGLSRAAAPAAPASVPNPPPAVVVRYTGGDRVRIRGSVSGRLYEFERGQAAPVAAADVPVMVRTGLFARN